MSVPAALIMHGYQTSSSSQYTSILVPGGGTFGVSDFGEVVSSSVGESGLGVVVFSSVSESGWGVVVSSVGESGLGVVGGAVKDLQTA